MPVEHRRPDGSWMQGYFCMTCGKGGLNMLGLHDEEKCDPNPELVKQLVEINKPEKYSNAR